MSQPQQPEPPEAKPPKFQFILFVAGEEPNSRMAKENLALLCRDIPGDRYEVQVVDVLQDFDAALKYNILLTPSLLITEPVPQVMIVGNLSDLATVRTALQVDKKQG